MVVLGLRYCQLRLHYCSPRGLNNLPHPSSPNSGSDSWKCRNLCCCCMRLVSECNRRYSFDNPSSMPDYNSAATESVAERLYSDRRDNSAKRSVRAPELRCSLGNLLVAEWGGQRWYR